MSPDATSNPDSHRRARRALVGLYAGILDDAESTWLTEHLASCDACCDMAHQMETESGALLGDGRHLPSRLMARWGVEYPRLEGALREFVDAHLESCAECRRGLEILGHEFERPAPAFAPRPVERPRPGFWESLSTKARWALAGPLVAATAALLMVLNPAVRTGLGRFADRGHPSDLPPLAGPVNPSTTPVNPPTTRPPVVREETPAVEQPLLIAWTDDSGPAAGSYAEVLLDQPLTRGIDDTDVIVHSVKAGVRTLRLMHPEAAYYVEGDKVRVDITLQTPSGKKLNHAMTVGELRRDRPLRLDLPGGVESGTYRYSYVFGPEAHEPPLRGEVTIQVR